MNQKSDIISHRRLRSKFDKQGQNLEENFPKLIATTSSQNNHCRENLLDSEQSDDDGYDMVAEANLAPQMVPEFLTGQPMQSRNNIPHQNASIDDTLETTLPAQQNPIHTKTNPH